VTTATGVKVGGEVTLLSSLHAPAATNAIVPTASRNQPLRVSIGPAPFVQVSEKTGK
jgi:hypothetical protein